MARFCPRTCSRLATAAVFISVGIVQLIAGMILLRSKYASMLSVPNFWTSAANMAVGALLGVSATIWKSTSSSKYASRRNILAALAISVIILNGTTAAILIVGEGNILLSIHLESNGIYSSTVLAAEMLAYAYATSVCSPIICVVVSIAFLLGLCFQTKSSKSKSLDLKNILRDDKPEIYSWVYTPRLPHPDPEVMRTAMASSDSGSSSSDSTSISSADVPISICSHMRTDEFNRSNHNGNHVSHNKETIRDQSGSRKYHPGPSIHSSCSKTSRVSFADEFVVEKNPAVRDPILGDELRSYPSVGKRTGDRLKSALAVYKTYEEVRLPSRNKKYRARPKILFMEYPSGEILHHIDREKALPEDRIQNSSGQFDTLAKLEKQSVKLKMATNVDSISEVHANTNSESSTRKMSPERSASVYEDAVQSPDLQQYRHGTLRRTPVAKHSKVLDVSSPEDSEIVLDSAFGSDVIPGNYIRSSQSPKTKGNLKKSTIMTNTGLVESNGNHFAGDVVSVPARNTGDFRSKLSSKLVPVSIPIVPGVHCSPKAIKYSPLDARNKMYSKSIKVSNKQEGYIQPTFSYFRKDIKRKEVGSTKGLDAGRKHKSLVKSSVESEFPSDELNDAFLHTFGHLSALDESDVEELARGKKPDYSSRKRRSCISSKNLNQSPHQNSIQSVIEKFAAENPGLSTEELIAQLYPSTVV